MEEIKGYPAKSVSADGSIKHEVLPKNHYKESRGKHQNACQGNYSVTENHINYINDPGLIADRVFKGEILITQE